MLTPSIIDQSQSQFVLIDKSKLFALLRDADNLQEAIDILDHSLVPVTKFNDGLSTKEDKAIIDYLAVNASDKIYVYSNQEQGLLSPTTRIIVADNEGLTIQYPTPDTARVGLSPHFNHVKTVDGDLNPSNENKSIEFSNSDTADVKMSNGKIYVDATKTKDYATSMAIVLGG